MSVVEDLKDAYDMIRELRALDEDRGEQCKLLMRISEKLKPYIQSVSKPVTLAWGVVSEDGEWSRFNPESKYSVNDLSSGEGILIWTHYSGDNLWLLSSGMFLYLQTLERKTVEGISALHDSWVGEPIECEDPSRLPDFHIGVVCGNLMDALLTMLTNVNEVDERSFQILLDFPQRYIFSFFRHAPCSTAALASYGERFKVKEYLIAILDETENKTTVGEVLEVLNKMCGWREMLDLIQGRMYDKPDSLRPIFNEWRARVIKSR